MGQGDREFLMEIQKLSCYQHKNLISLVGFCEEGEEKVLVFVYAKHGSLDKYLSDDELSWIQRLRISIGAAHGLSYLHNDVGPQHRVMHRDIKSSNILLNENWEAKISDFGLSKIGPSNVEFTFLVTSACGTFGYVDPQYIKTGILTKESDVYSFGVVLFEILCGRLALMDQYQDERRFLASLAQRCYEENRLNEIINPNLLDQMKVDSLNMFSMVAYQCLNENRSERPTMSWIVEKLEKALVLQECNGIDFDAYKDVPLETGNDIDFDEYENIPVAISGENAPPPVTTFEEMDLGDALNLNIRRYRYDKPTLVQRHAIPISLAGRDLMACVQTSTGKTAAFCFPIISGIIRDKAAQRPHGAQTVFPLALILSPTREVLCQIYVEAQKFAYQTGVKVVMVYGGAPVSQQLYELEKGVDILLATPRRLIDLLEGARVSLQMIRYLVLDEADVMLDMGLESRIRKIVEQTDMPPRGARQTMMFSATFHREIQRLATDFLSNYISLTIGRVDSSTES